MASARRPRTTSKPTTRIAGGVDRDEDGIGKSKFRKRKLTDILGPPWSEEDLELFYQAFRKYGKDWKKVSASLHKRTTEMVEALYTTNKAYLSLPDGAASATGLKAMMTDHYNLLVENPSAGAESSDDCVGSDERSNHVQLSKKKVTNIGMESSSIRSDGIVGASGFGGSSPAKRPRTYRNRPVGKRTPRFQTSNASERRIRIIKASVSKLQNRVEEDSDSDVAAARTLVSKQSASPTASNTPSRRSLRQTSFQQNGDKESLWRTESDASVKPTASTSQADNQLEGSPESKDLQNEGATKASSSTLRSDADRKTPTVGDAKSKLKKPFSKKTKFQNSDSKHQTSKSREKRKEDVKELVEASERQGSGADEPAEGSSQPSSAQRRRRPVSPPPKQKKRSRQLFSGDSNSGLDALATLAASSLELEGLELGENLNVVANAAASFEDKTEKVEIKGGKQSSPEVANSKHDLKSSQAEDMQDLHNGSKEEEGDLNTEEEGAASEDRQPSTSPADSRKRKRKHSGDKISKVVASVPEGEASASPNPWTKLKKLAGTKLLSSKQGHKLLKRWSESGVADGADSPGHGKQISMEGREDLSIDIDESSLPLKLRSKKKGVPEKLPTEKTSAPVKSNSGFNSPHQESVRKEQAFCPHTTPELGTDSAKAKIIHCLCPKVRRWCMCEWFYSAIDLPWFARNEFVEYLNHAGLGHVPRLTRVEWGVIRGSLGKPRRLSKRFLQEEREKLETYRESVRTHYHELRNGLREGLPADLARPLTVGQKVIARHPKTREIHDGSILTVDRSRCRVQFDRPELGVELVMDIDAMPMYPLENVPEVMRRHFTSVEGIERTPGDDSKPRAWNASGGVGGVARAALNERLERRVTMLSQRFLSDLSKRAQTDTLDAVREAKEVTNRAVREAKDVTTKSAVASQRVGSHQPLGGFQAQAIEADARALAELARALDKKEALVMELRQMNGEASCNWEGFKAADNFQRQYATVVLQLKEVNKQVTNALLLLRQRNKYHDNAVLPWHRLSSQGISDVAEPSEPWVLDTTCALAEVTISARKQASLMVSTAVKAMDTLKAGEDAFQKLGCALEAISVPGCVSVPLQLSPYPAPTCEVGGSQGVSTPSAQPGSRVQSSSSSITEDNSEVDTGTVASTSRLSPVDKNGSAQRPAALEAAAQDLMQDLNHAATQSSASRDCLFPMELIKSCIATLFMLQTLSETPFSSAEVQQTLDSALRTLRPKSAKNHAIYKEIEQQFATVKAQITTQIPFPNSAPLSPFVDSMPSVAPKPTPPNTL
ncbi:protein ALWAYS EARLY 3 isoform X1 [Physcomitrium patens]|uniref:SANT domain-containing protein n=1 Tax=Physcomitrium patens TaxID=3218 RepID=A0A2K1JVW8_PHYPA|nr:protein ALWAYS EARLY 3-like isoform X1 [Physcomitrium patens]XP_024388271.1 protein ALWAYS EARLY 3-like isoform X1 [Physcomitrium patens]XP_024388272.1 protein ALWAYS EARLY 3-like isoform X1 [Physcomitrium patens]PNR45675.1 hypothetical protein PHYPA_015446 [Physcomitrium patens]|eukprot:XP_024388270.1 protein ALWAYS EARLY 3-like isoform X1 [Physcomitrella patens]